MKKLVIVLTVVMIAALLFTGCKQVNNAPIIESTPVTTATIGTEYSYTVTATDADGDTLTYEVSGPTGMVISSAGVISGWTPTAAGTVNVIVTVSDGKDPVTQSFTIVVPSIGPTEITIEVDGEYRDGAKDYVKGGIRGITVTFPGPIKDIPEIKIGEVVVPVFSLDNKVWTGSGLFKGDSAVLIKVSGVCEEELCAAKAVVVDSGKPYAELKATVAECECETGYALTISSDWKAETECETFPGCCGDAGSGLASWNIKIFHDYPWDACCEPDPCVVPNAEEDDTECPITITKECIDEVFVPDECGVGGHWEDFFDSNYWVVATLTDNVGNEMKYYGEVVNVSNPDGALGGELVSFVELHLDPTTSYCTCPAEDPNAADLIIGDCDGTPTTECWEEPLDPCPEVTVKPAKPIVGQPAAVTIDYTDAVKPTGKVSAYVGPAFKTLPLGVPEGSSELPLEEVEDFIYQAYVTFGEAGDRIIYVVDACEDCPPCTYNITVLPADVCPIVKFLDYTWWEEVDGKEFTFGEYDIPGYGLTNVNFTVTFANRVEKELVKVYVGIPGLGPIFMPIPMPPTALQVAMTTTDEVTYNGTIPIGDIKEVVVGVINHMSGLQPGDPGWVDPDQPFQSLPSDIQYLIHTLGCIPLRIYVLAGDPCCIEVCEYPFLVDPIGPFANLEVELEECVKWYCFEDDCIPVPYPGHELIIYTETPGECTLEECCNDTCCGLARWESWIVPCYFGELPPPNQMPQGPFDECCDFDERLIPLSCALWLDIWDWYHWSDDCPVEFSTGCVFDWADPMGFDPKIDDMDLSEIWESVWYLYVKMYDCAENTTEYKARITFRAEEMDTGDWDITIATLVPLCDDALDGVFGADYCVGPHF